MRWRPAGRLKQQILRGKVQGAAQGSFGHSGSWKPCKRWPNLPLRAGPGCSSMRRKTRNALLLSALSALAALGASIAVQAASDVPDQAWFAPRMAGDAGEYRLTVLDHDGDVVSDELAFRFRWLAPTQARDESGTLHVSNPVVVETPTTQEPLLETHSLDPGRMGDQFASLRQGGDAVETLLVPMAPTVGSSTASRLSQSLDLEEPGSRAMLPCPLALRPAGRAVSLRDPVALLFECQGPATPSFEPLYRAVRTDRLGGRDTIVFEGRTDGVLGGGPTGVWVWIASDLPYPVQVAERSHGQTVVHRLARFERGTAPLAAPSPAGEAPAPLDFVERLPWGMDDSGVDHPWPLSSAWMHAHEDPLAPGMRDWLADHPQAYTARAQGRIIDLGDERQIEWQWVLSDGHEQLTVGHSRIDAINPAPATPALAGLLPATVTTRYEYDNRSLADEPEAFAPVEGLAHPRLPTVASLARHWRLHSGDARLDGWSFTDACYSNTCELQEAHRSVGTYRWLGEAVGGKPASVVFGWDLEYDVLDLSLPFQDGIAFVGVVRHSADAVQLVVAGVPLASATAQPPGRIVVAAQAWQASDPAGIVAVGVLATIVFVAVRFGGALLGLPLFSRIQDPDLLKHPLRRTVHQAVEANPGIHLKALARTVGRPRNTVEHHVRKLVAGGLLSQHEINGFSCLFVKGQVDRREQAAAGALKSEAARKVLAAVVAAPGASGRDVALQAGLAPTLVSYHASNLQKAGLVEGRRHGRELRLLATELGRKSAASVA